MSSSFTVTNVSGTVGPRPGWSKGRSMTFTAVVTDAADLPDVYEHPAQAATKALAERRREMGSNGAEWYGLPYSVRDVEKAAFEILESGWAEGVEKMRKLERASAAFDFPPPVSIKRRQVWSDDGDDLDSDRYYAGRFEDMWRGAKRRVVMTQQVISLIVPWGGISNVSADELQYNGLAVMLLSDILEEAGYSTEIIGASGVTLGGPHVLRYVVAKRPGEPLQLDVIAATLAHPAVFRVFGISCNYHGTRRDMWTSGATDAPNDYLEIAADNGVIPRADVVMNNAYSEREAIDAVKKALEQLAQSGAIQTL